MPGLRTIAAVGVAAIVMTTTAGCSSRPKADPAAVDAFVQSRVDLMRQLADEVAKDPGGVSVAGLVEEFSQGAIDPEAHPAQVAEILKIYNERVKGKIRGEAAVQLQGAIGRLQPPRPSAADRSDRNALKVPYWLKAEAQATGQESTSLS